MFSKILHTVKDAVGAFFGNYEYRTLLPWLIMLAIVDYAAATVCALLGKAKHGAVFSSSIGFLGIVKKVFAFVVIAIAFAVDQALAMNTLCPATTRGLIINEAISALQNISVIGTWIPPTLRIVLLRLKNGTAQKGSQTS